MGLGGRGVARVDERVDCVGAELGFEKEEEAREAGFFVGGFVRVGGFEVCGEGGSCCGGWF